MVRTTTATLEKAWQARIDLAQLRGDINQRTYEPFADRHLRLRRQPSASARIVWAHAVYRSNSQPRSCIAPILCSRLSNDDGCASETAFQTCTKSTLVEPSVQEPSIKGVSATGAIYDVNLLCFAEKTLTPEMGFGTRVTQSDYHSRIVIRRPHPSTCHSTFMLVHFQLDFIHEDDVD
jgi:hypothetical protein